MQPARLLLVALVVLVLSLGFALFHSTDERAVRGPAIEHPTPEAQLGSAQLEHGEPSTDGMADAAVEERAPVEALATGTTLRPRDPLVHGRVFASDQRRLQDVIVTAFAPHGPLTTRTPLAGTTTDENGRFQFPDLEHEVLLVCQGEGLLPRYYRARPDELAEIELRYSVRLVGRVLDAATRAPLEGVEVRHAIRHFDTEELGLRSELVARTDAEGRWNLPYAESGRTARLVVKGHGLAPAIREVQVREDTDEEIVLLLGEGRPLRIRAVELASGAPAQRVSIRLDGELALGTDDRGEAATLEDAEGSKRSRNVAANLKSGAVTKGRLSPEARQGALPPVIPILVGGRVQGRVLDAAGLPVEGALVRLAGSTQAAKLGPEELRRGWKFEDGRRSARTDATGAFELVGLVPRAKAPHLRVTHDDFESRSTEPFEFARDGLLVERDVRVVRGGRVFGVVTFDGEPLSTVVRWIGDGGAGSDTSNDRGEYELTGLPAGSMEVFAELSGRVGRNTARSETFVVSLAEAEQRRLDLFLSDDRAPIAGTVATLDGRALGGIRVQARATLATGERLQFRTDTDAEGSFHLEVATEPGLTYRVDALFGSERASIDQVQPGTPDLELRFAEQGALLLAVRDATTGELVDDLEISYRASGRTGESRGWRGVARKGRSLVHGAGEELELRLPMGRVDLLVGARNKGYPLVEVLGLEVLDEPRRSHSVLLVSGTRLELVFTDAADRPRRPRTPRRQSWRIQWRPEEGTPESELPGWARELELRIGKNGRASLPGVPPGRWRVRPPRGVSSKAIRPRSFEVRATDRQTVRIRVDETGRR